MLLWLLLGAFYTITHADHSDSEAEALRMLLCLYDFVLGCLGILTTWTASQDFPHQHIRNAKGQSGPLSQNSTVTQSEMIEHLFYQGLNLLQSMYLHALSYWNRHRNFASTSTSIPSHIVRLLALFVVTSPWLIRQRFPVHSFSTNWKLASETLQQTESTELWLYRIKKMQYLFYKHVVFHGVNLSVAIHSLRTLSHLPWTNEWRIFWLALNTSYVMEFFLQTLVKRKKLAQVHMLWFQRLLMLASSWAALEAVLPVLPVMLCLASLILNLIRRHRDVMHTMMLALSAMAWNLAVNSSSIS